MLTNSQSIILTVHNKDFLIDNVLNAIKKNTTGQYELIIVLDGCTDNSKTIVDNFKKNNKNIKINILETPDVYEIMANNAGLRVCNSEIAILIQDDVIVNEEGWNHRLTKPFRTFDDVFAVTANCAHNWEFNPNSKHILTNVNNNYEWSDIINHIDHANRNTISRDTFGIRQCANRGPLALNYSDIKSLGFFDESFYPTYMDDHDLCFRMSDKFNKVVGCYWIDFISDLAWGGSRISGTDAGWVLEANQKNTRVVYSRHQDKIKNKIIENRNC
jgi:glycosyltransferase involved in cell wall biosynthesis